VVEEEVEMEVETTTTTVEEEPEEEVVAVQYIRATLDPVTATAEEVVGVAVVTEVVTMTV